MAPDADQKDIDLMIEKYELYIESAFEPYAAMHECRQHSNLWGKMVLWGDDALMTDHVGYYSKAVSVHGTPNIADFTEQYPHMVGAWVYDHQYLNQDFNYADLESEYLKKESRSDLTASQAKQTLDQQHWMFAIENPQKEINAHFSTMYIAI